MTTAQTRDAIAPEALNRAILAACDSPRICSVDGHVTKGIRCGPCEHKALQAALAKVSALEAEVRETSRLLDNAKQAVQCALNDLTEARALAQRSGEERDRAVADAARLNSFVAFVLKWCDRGPPHGGPGNEAVALGAIAHHPIIRNARQVAARSVIEPTEGESDTNPTSDLGVV